MAKMKYPPVLVGNVYGKLTVISEAEKVGRQKKYNCVCACGNKTISFGFTLKDGGSKSCGCIAAQLSKDRWENPTDEMRQVLIDANTNRTHGLSKHSIYHAWADMKRRCLNTEYEWYPSYGGRGIDICERWMNSVNFIHDMLPTWESGLQLGRIDNELGYSPENCRWETPTQNQNNKSNTVYIDAPDGRMTLYDAKNLYGLNRDCIKYRHDVGMRGSELIKPSQRK
jgi:hypothetical protein